MTSTLMIYVADLAAYNNSYLHGVWIDATQDIEIIREKVLEMISQSQEPDAEEYAIHDYEGFAPNTISEYMGLEEVHEIACFYQKYPAFAGELINYCDIDDAKKYAENYLGCYQSLGEYAEECISNILEVPRQLEFYIDYESMGRDMDLEGSIFSLETGCNEVHIFLP